MVDRLLASGANANVLGGATGSPLHAAIERGSFKMVKMSVHAGADVTQLSEGPMAILYRSLASVETKTW